MSLDMFKHVPFKNPDHLQQESDALREAGMPEKPPGAVQYDLPLLASFMAMKAFA